MVLSYIHIDYIVSIGLLNCECVLSSSEKNYFAIHYTLTSRYYLSFTFYRNIIQVIHSFVYVYGIIFSHFLRLFFISILKRFWVLRSGLRYYYFFICFTFRAFFSVCIIEDFHLNHIKKKRKTTEIF